MGIIKPIAPSPALYATAPEKTGDGKKDESLGLVTLNGALDGYARQIWQVKVVDEEKGIYNINRADIGYMPPERAPTFGIAGDPEDRKPISCIRFADADPIPPNPSKWKVLHSPPKDTWLQQSMFSIIPVPPEGQEPQYFIDDQTPLINSQQEGYKTEAAQGPETSMVLSKLEGYEQAHAWYFEPY